MYVERNEQSKRGERKKGEEKDLGEDGELLKVRMGENLLKIILCAITKIIHNINMTK